MTRAHLLVIFGLLVALSPFSGLPSAWLEWLLPAIGIVTVFIGFTYRAHGKPESAPFESAPAS